MIGTDNAPQAAPDLLTRVRSHAAGIAVAGVMGVAIAALAFASLTPLAVRVDGERMRVPVGSTAGELARTERIAGLAGDLRSVSGKLLRKGGGHAPVLTVDGAQVASSAPVPDGAQVASSRGADATEATRVITTETVPAVKFVGSGPVESVEQSGTPGQIRTVVGLVSGEEASKTVLSKGEPMIVRRERAYKGAKRVALTFDDGPWPNSTDAILKELTDAKVKATFFMVGRQVKARPEMAQRVAAAGMEVGNHSYSHRYLSNVSRSVVRSEIAKADSAIEAVLGKRPVWYRPAGGITSAIVFREAASLKNKIVLWSVDPQDWARPGTNKIARRVLNGVRPGAVILMHDGGGDRSQTVAALRKVLAGLKARGYEAVTLSELYAR